MFSGSLSSIDPESSRMAAMLVAGAQLRVRRRPSQSATFSAASSLVRRIVAVSDGRIGWTLADQIAQAAVADDVSKYRWEIMVGQAKDAVAALAVVALCCG